MKKNKKFCLISEFGKSNKLEPLQFYKMLSRHLKLARKMKWSKPQECLTLSFTNRQEMQ